MRHFLARGVVTQGRTSGNSPAPIPTPCVSFRLIPDRLFVSPASLGGSFGGSFGGSSAVPFDVGSRDSLRDGSFGSLVRWEMLVE